MKQVKPMTSEELAADAAKKCSSYLITGMHHCTKDGQDKMAEIIRIAIGKALDNFILS